MLGKIQELRKRIIKALEQGESTADLEKQLKHVRELQDMERANREMTELVGIARQRRQWKLRAKEFQSKTRHQAEAISRFMEQRDQAVKAITDLMPRVKALQDAQKQCCRDFSDQEHWEAEARRLPQGLLPEDFTGTILKHKLFGTRRGRFLLAEYEHRRYNRVTVDALTAAALTHLELACELLTGAFKHTIPVPAGLTSSNGMGFEEAEEDPGRCSVCSHPAREAIEKAIQEGVPLRDIENQYGGTSKSSLSRHKQHMAERVIS